MWSSSLRFAASFVLVCFITLASLLPFGSGDWRAGSVQRQEAVQARQALLDRRDTQEAKAATQAGSASLPMLLAIRGGARRGVRCRRGQASCGRRHR